jgi:hypothetical protein
LWTEGDFANALGQADEALYRAKRAGKSQAQFHQPTGPSQSVLTEAGIQTA